jgi:excisionase family DNA binding protein
VLVSSGESWEQRISRRINADGSVNVPAYIAKWLESRAKITADYRVRLRDNNSELYEVLMAIHSAPDDRSTDGTKLAVANRNQPPLDAWITPAEAADELHVTDRCVRNWCKSGKLAATLKGGRWLIRRTDLHTYRLIA